MKDELLAKAYANYAEGIFSGVAFVNGVIVDCNGNPITDQKILITMKVFVGEALSYDETVFFLGRKLTKVEAEEVLGKKLTNAEYEAL